MAAPKAEVEQILRDNFLPIDKITLHINALVVKTGRNVILMDTGHLPFTGIGHVRAGKGGTSYQWVPVEWQWQA